MTGKSDETTTALVPVIYVVLVVFVLCPFVL